MKLIHKILNGIRSLTDPAYRTPRNPHYDEKEWVINGYHLTHRGLLEKNKGIYRPRIKIAKKAEL